MLALRTGEKKAMVGAMIGSLTCVVIKIWMVVSPKIKMKIKIRKKKTCMVKIRMVVSPCKVDGQHVAGDPVVEEPQQQRLAGLSGNNQNDCE